MAKFKLFQNTERKHFSWGFFYPEFRNSRLQTYNVREKEQSLEHSFLSDFFKKSICSGVFSSSIPSIVLKRNSTT